MFKKTILILLLSSVSIYAYQDYDVDGVDDTIDRCPNTSFDAIVDAFGCPIDKNKKKNYFGKFTLQLGTQLLQDNTYESSNALNLYANYRYKDWDISLSNLRNTTVGSFTEDNFNSENDIYLSTGYFFTLSQNTLKLSLGTRFLSNASDTQYNKQSTNKKKRKKMRRSDASKNDYFASLNYHYVLNQKQSLFLFTAYTVISQKQKIYQDYGAFSLGTGYKYQ